MRKVKPATMMVGVAAKALAASALLMLVSGCASIRDHRGYLVDSALVEAVHPGIDNKQSVEKTLGRPTFVSQFGTPTWYYISIFTKQRPFGRPKAKEELQLKISFDAAGRVTKVDRAGMEQVASISPDGHRTPTLGRDRSFFEDLFGNIGAVGAVPGGGSTGPKPGSGPNGS